MKALSPEQIEETRFANKYEFERAMGMRAATSNENRRQGKHAAQKEGSFTKASGKANKFPRAKNIQHKCRPKYQFE